VVQCQGEGEGEGEGEGRGLLYDRWVQIGTVERSARLRQGGLETSKISDAGRTAGLVEQQLDAGRQFTPSDR
jgi:hypothetical protein